MYYLLFRTRLNSNPRVIFLSEILASLWGMLTDEEINVAADEAERALERRQEEWDMEQADLSYGEPDPEGYQSHVNALSGK